MAETDSRLGSCFVTGGAGFIGSHLVERLLAEGNTVTVFDNLSSGDRSWMDHLEGCDRFRFIQGDLTDLEAVKDAIRGHSFVFHLGANGDIQLGHKQTDLDLRNSTIATYNVLEAMRLAGVDKIVFSSSCAVYGDTPPRPTTESSGPLLPISLYAAAKLACEGLISAYCHLFGMQAWMFRFGNVVGARMGHGVIFDFIQKLQCNPEEMEILGDGNQEKNFFLVEDCIDGILFAVRKVDADACDVFNVGCRSTIKVVDIARIVVEEMGLTDVRFRFAGGIRGWPGDVPLVIYDVSKLERLGWRAHHSSEEAVRLATRRLLGKHDPGNESG